MTGDLFSVDRSLVYSTSLMTKVHDGNRSVGSTSDLAACSDGIIYHRCASQSLPLRTSRTTLIFFFPTVKLSRKLEEPVKTALQMSPHSSSQMSEKEH